MPGPIVLMVSKSPNNLNFIKGFWVKQWHDERQQWSVSHNHNVHVHMHKPMKTLRDCGTWTYKANYSNMKQNLVGDSTEAFMNYQCKGNMRFLDKNLRARNICFVWAVIQAKIVIYCLLSWVYGNWIFILLDMKTMHACIQGCNSKIMAKNINVQRPPILHIKVCSHVYKSCI